jgi:hypothetical protein
MIAHYDSERQVFICQVNKAIKDNKVAKKGEPYIWVKKTSFSLREYFKTIEEVDKIYPKHFNLSSIQLIKILKEYKKQYKLNNKIKEEKFLKDINLY